MKTGLSSAGFTLAELLVVVAILSATALAAFGLVNEDRTQVRIDDTRNRLAILRRAIIGPESPAYGGEMRLAGYVADNGRLPQTLGALLNIVDENVTRPRAGVTPKLATTVDPATCIQTGGVDLDDAARVIKGHRGNYLASVAARGGEFRDGWGNVSPVDDSDNFGWEWKWTGVGFDELTITSLGADNISDGEPPPDLEAEVDQSMLIGDLDWRVPIDGWTVTLRNANALASAGNPDEGDIDVGDSGLGITGFSKLGLVLLVFENDGGSDGNGRWRQYRSNQTSCTASDDSVLKPRDSCKFSFVPDGDGKIACGTGSIDAKVPIGRHVLLLTVKNGAESIGLPPAGKYRIVTQVDFFPGALPPNLVWEVR
ncbi:MAG: type II secretion system GspH family protein [Azoarcus sp.]|jgi:prepilin-type N-terminal cleavage/methylation domain-containing protein|nr:type II secretion system GspH family protein [Azoarcus sp.]